MIEDVQNLTNLAPNVAIVGIFIWYISKKDKQSIEQGQISRDAFKDQEKRFVESAKIKDEHHAKALENFTKAMNKVSEYLPRVTDALEKYNDYFPIIYQHNVEMSKQLKKGVRNHDYTTKQK